MKLKVAERDRARTLRKDGYTLNEIRDEIPNVSKSTLSGWLKRITLSQAQQERITEKMRQAGHAGRQLGAQTNRAGREQRFALVTEQARIEFPKRSGDPLFQLGLALYWAEGSKTQETFQFTNSDPAMIQLMLRWLTNCADVPRTNIRARIYAHRLYEDQQPEKHWQTITGLPLDQFRRTVYKATLHTVRKNPTYLGCCRLEVYGVALFWKVMTWQQQLANLYTEPVITTQ